MTAPFIFSEPFIKQTPPPKVASFPVTNVPSSRVTSAATFPKELELTPTRIPPAVLLPSISLPYPPVIFRFFMDTGTVVHTESVVKLLFGKPWDWYLSVSFGWPAFSPLV